jgi:UPF0716 family protein affecting phage T7 exclusion
MSRILVLMDMLTKASSSYQLYLCVMKVRCFTMMVLSSPIIFVKNNFVLLLSVCFLSMTHFVLLPVVYTHFYGILICREGGAPTSKNIPLTLKAGDEPLNQIVISYGSVNAVLTSLSI